MSIMELHALLDRALASPFAHRRQMTPEEHERALTRALDIVAERNRQKRKAKRKAQRAARKRSRA